MADNRGVRDVAGQVTDPARHQIKDMGARGEPRAVEGAERFDRRFVDVRDQAGGGIEVEIFAGVLLVERVGRQAELVEFRHAVAPSASNHCA